MRALAELPEGETATLAVVVAVTGSAYRRPGAARLVVPGRPPAGVVSGGCLEADLDLREPRRDGRGELRRYDMRGGPEDLWGVASGCHGIVEVWLQPIPAGQASPYRSAARWLAEGRAVRVVTMLESGRQWAEVDGDPSGAHRRGVGERAFVDARSPAPAMLVYGRGADAGPMVAGAQAVGFRVGQVGQVDDLTAHLATARPAAAVVMSHHFPGDQAALAALVAAGVPYIGVLGPLERTRRLLPPPWPPALHAPLGLDIGAESAEEIAVAAVAQALAVLRGAGGGHLGERDGPIHRAGVAAGL